MRRNRTIDQYSTGLAGIQYCWEGDMHSAPVHQSPYSGSWYPGDASSLTELLDKLFAESKDRTGAGTLARPAGFVVPHAGLVYSGRVAAAAYRHFEQEPPARLILMGFAHHGAPTGVWVPAVEAYRTPLGEIPVDRRTAEELLAGGVFRWMREDALCDHSVEIQLPLLQRVVPGLEFVPVYVSTLGPGDREEAARILASVMEPGTVVLASSDLTHYGTNFGYKPFPHDEQTPHRLRLLDEGFIEAAGSLDADLLMRTLRSEAATVCGREPIALLLTALAGRPDGEDIFQLALDYETSGDITGDYSHCVSYAALGYFPWDSFLLEEAEQQLLLDSARRTLRHYQETGEAKPQGPERTTAALERSAGAFVTLHKDGQLRGCVGRCTAASPLANVIPEMTLAAALEDTRFEPLRPDEEGIDIEISVLSPLKRLTDYSRFRVGRDGGHLKIGGLSGLLLPQVAEGRGWTADDFLDALARKTRVDRDVYGDPTARFSVFRAQVIH